MTYAAPTVCADIEDHLQQLEQRLEGLNQQIQALGHQQTDWSRKDQLLQSVMGNELN